MAKGHPKPQFLLAEDIDFGQRVMFTRKRMGLTQKAIEAMFGIPRDQISRIENGLPVGKTRQKIRIACENLRIWAELNKDAPRRHTYKDSLYKVSRYSKGYHGTSTKTLMDKTDPRLKEKQCQNSPSMNPFQDLKSATSSSKRSASGSTATAPSSKDSPTPDSKPTSKSKSDTFGRRLDKLWSGAQQQEETP